MTKLIVLALIALWFISILCATLDTIKKIIETKNKDLKKEIIRLKYQILQLTWISKL